jgi:hypothetical protein
MKQIHVNQQFIDEVIPCSQHYVSLNQSSAYTRIAGPYEQIFWILDCPKFDTCKVEGAMFQSVVGPSELISACRLAQNATCAMLRKRCYKGSPDTDNLFSASGLPENAPWARSRKRSFNGSLGSAISFYASWPAEKATCDRSRKLCFEVFRSQRTNFCFLAAPKFDLVYVKKAMFQGVV